MTVLKFLLDTVFFLLIAACLLRAWMNTCRLRMTEQPGPFVMALTHWLVGPLRRLLPRGVAQMNADVGSLVAALLLALAYGVLLWLLLVGAAPLANEAPWAGWSLWLLALQMLVRSGLQLVFVLVLVYALFSWVQPQAPLMYRLARLVEPLLAPLRRVVPLIGGVDLSALVLLVLLQVGLMLLA